MFYLFKNGKCESLCDNKERLETLITENDKDAVILEHESWLNPSDLIVVDGKIKVHEIVQTDAEIKATKLAIIESTYQPKFTSLKEAKVAAELMGKNSDEIATQYQAVFKQYLVDKEAING